MPKPHKPMDYAVLDIETTGGQYNEEGITEIAIHRYDGVQVVDKFISLVNPEKEIQPYVVQLTGINNKMLRNAPKFHEVAKRIVEITSGCTLVAHNASFDYRVLKNQFSLLGYDFDLPTLCTVELSKKLIPDQETYSLGKLCRAIGIPVSDRHRANGDAIAALKLFEVLLQKDKEKSIVKQTVRKGNRRDLSDRLLRILEEMPDKSGLFYFHRYNGDLLHIGRGKNIKSEVNQLFLRSSKRSRSLIKEMQSVSFELTGNELISSLKFHEELSVHRPKYNRRMQPSTRANLRLNSENMVLLDKGRSPEEKSVILVENGLYLGYGYAELSHQFRKLEVLKSLITPTRIQAKGQQLIKQYLNKNQVERIIRF